MQPALATCRKPGLWSHVITWLFAAGILFVYLLHAAPGAWWGDGQEFACAAWTLGIPHPTGYPLYTVLGHGWMKLLAACGASDPGQSLTWMSAVALALAIGLIVSILQRVVLENPARLQQGDYRGRELSALIPALGFGTMLAFGITVFQHATFAEVYPLTFLFVAIILNVAWRTDMIADARLIRRAGLLGGVLGLAMLNHYSILALAPLVLFIVVKWERRSARPWLTLALAFECFSLMLLGYLYLPMRAKVNPPLNWGDPSNWERLLWVLKGGQFNELKMGAEGQVLQGLLLWLSWWGRQWIPGHYANPLATVILGGALLAIAFFGLILFRRAQAGLGWGLIFTLITTAFFAAFYHIPDIDAYFLPALPAAAIGWLVAGQWIIARLRQRGAEGRKLPALISVIPLALGCIVFWGQKDNVDKRFDDAPAVWGKAALDTLPLNAMILTQGDADIYSLWYQQMVLGHRLDVTVFGSQFIFQDWYSKMFENRPVGAPVIWTEKRGIGPKIIYDVAIFGHILLPNFKNGIRIFTTFIDPLYPEFLQPTTAVKGPLLPDIYYHQPEFKFGLPSPFIYELHPNPKLANMSHDELKKTFEEFYRRHPEYVR